MSIYERARRMALAALCCCGLVVAGGAMLTPTFAFAVECDKTTGSGSTLQTIIQRALIPEFEKAPGNGCTGSKSIEYNKPIETGSGQGLEEFGMQGSNVLAPTKSGNGVKLDGFVGTDEPPTEAKVKMGKEAAETSPITVPVFSAPVAIIFHPPAGCQIKVAKWKVPNQELDLFYRHKITWKEFAEQIGAGKPEGTLCNVTATVEVRSDNSGTSFATKQYLSQIKSKVWEEKFINNETDWPAETEAKTEHVNGSGMKVANKGSNGEAQAVAETANAVGYVNVGNAPANGIKAWLNNGQNKTFWGQVQNNGLEVSGAEVAEPVKPSGAKTIGNCPTGEYTFKPSKLETQVKAKPPVWGGVELANVTTSGAYPLCTFTYNVAWEDYTKAKFKITGGYGNLGKQVGNTTKEYLKFVLKEGQMLIESGVPEFYSPLPENIKKIALNAVETEVDSV